MIKITIQVYAVIFLLIGAYIDCRYDDYSRATYYVALACFAAIITLMTGETK